MKYEISVGRFLKNNIKKRVPRVVHGSKKDY